MNHSRLFFFFSFIITAFLILDSCPLVLSSSSSPIQLLALLSIKSSLKDPLNTFKDWDPTTSFSRPGSEPPAWCSWVGVRCDEKTGQVTGLDLPGRNLSGLIPNEIRYLTHLHHLNLSRNVFDGPLPPSIYELPNLKTLDINHNSFSSNFSTGISRLKSLTSFNAYSNSFTGPLPEELVGLENLEYLNLGGSYFEGEIPASYGNFSKLRSLYLHGNYLTGRIPPELGSSGRLEHVELGYNTFSGGVPPEFSSMSGLIYIDISSANISGELPPEWGGLDKLETLLLFKNRISGSIPESWAVMKSLQILDLSDNEISGEIPSGISGLKGLNTISLMNNKLTGEIPIGIGELQNLSALSLWNNSLTGMLPQKLGLNGKLQRLDVSSNSLSGPIPANLCSGNSLTKLILFSNRFVGPIPYSLANCTALVRLRIQNNYLNGSIPVGFGSLPNLTFFEISRNNLSGPIPRDLGDSVKLECLNMSGNSFRSQLPNNIWNAPSLQILSASSAQVNGNIPDFIGCKNLYKIELGNNDLNGSIPWDITHCEKLVTLNLRRNSLTGIIPWEISTLPSITEVDLSHNLLTGTIPSNFNNCTTLESFNVSYNQLTGPVFSSLHDPSSFAGNEGLCGDPVRKPCRTSGFEEDVEVHNHPKKTAGAVVWIVACGFGVGLFVLIAGARCFQAKYNFAGGERVGPWRLTAFQRLSFSAEDVLECVDAPDKVVVGMGSTGTVYRAEMPGGEVIAVKKLWAKNKNEAIRKRRGVLAEVEVLGNVRHRNIVRLLGCCSNNKCTMLLYEYMSNGSLDDLLHGKNKAGEEVVGDWVTRYKIALGVAQGICYLHHDCDPVIVHRDLKPSNILLDVEMEARVADFGVAKLIQTDESMSVIAGSYGYIAPEYAYTLQVDEKSDIYSYGVVLMEILTGKRSVDSEFGDGNSIVDWVRSKAKIKDGIKDILDKNCGASCASIREEMMLLLPIALLCTSSNPADRPTMRDVVSMLQEARPERKLNGGSGGDFVADDPKKPALD